MPRFVYRPANPTIEHHFMLGDGTWVSPGRLVDADEAPGEDWVEVNETEWRTPEEILGA